MFTELAMHVFCEIELISSFPYSVNQQIMKFSGCGDYKVNIIITLSIINIIYFLDLFKTSMNYIKQDIRLACLGYSTLTYLVRIILWVF